MCIYFILEDGRCLIFGGHFRTFDERHFSFQGECKYQLAIDCSSNHSFAVRMSTAPAGAAQGLRSKLVTIKVSLNLPFLCDILSYMCLINSNILLEFFLCLIKLALDLKNKLNILIMI